MFFLPAPPKYSFAVFKILRRKPKFYGKTISEHPRGKQRLVGSVLCVHGWNQTESATERRKFTGVHTCPSIGNDREAPFPFQRVVFRSIKGLGSFKMNQQVGHRSSG